MHFMGSSTIPMHRANGWYIIGATQSLLLFLQEVSNSSCQTLMSLYCITYHNSTVLQNDKRLSASQIFRVICQKILFVFIYVLVTLFLFSPSSCCLNIASFDSNNLFIIFHPHFPCNIF